MDVDKMMSRLREDVRRKYYFANQEEETEGDDRQYIR